MHYGLNNKKYSFQISDIKLVESDLDRDSGMISTCKFEMKKSTFDALLSESNFGIFSFSVDSNLSQNILEAFLDFQAL